METYSTNWEHLSHWLLWLEGLLKNKMDLMRDRGSNPLFISPEEARDLLFAPNPSDSRPPGEGLNQIKEEIRRKEALTLEEGKVFLTLPYLKKSFSLSLWEEKILLLLLAPEVSLSYGKLYAYLQDDMTARLPTAGLIYALLQGELHPEAELSQCFCPTAPLLRHRLIQKALSGHPQPYSQTPLKMNERLVHFFLSPHSRQPFSPLVEVQDIPLEWEDIFLTPSLIESLKKTVLLENTPPVLYFRGMEFTGKEEAARALCNQLNCPLVTFNLASLPLERNLFEEVIWELNREVLLQQGALYLEGADDFFFRPDVESYYRNRMTALLSQGFYFSILSGERPGSLMIPGKTVLIFNFTLPPSFMQKDYWQSLLPLSPQVADALSSTFSLSGPLIQKAVKEAREISLLEGKAGDITEDVLRKACISQSHHNLTNLASQIQPFYNFEDLVLPPDSLASLQEICLHIQHKEKIFGKWGFGQRYSDQGLAALFSGESGTGKTMASQVIAGAVGLDLFRIDLSRVVSKYIGETEKSLSRIFEEAERSHCILFFDEADALFGRRSEVESSHDRYANIEIDYLLQRMETFGGVMILATNFQENIDDAFMRRMRFLVEFPFPGKEERLKIWKKIFPSAAPLHKDVDLDFVAENFPISGGNIRNIALNGAFLAAGEKKIRMNHIILAARREYDKMGRRVTRRDFGKYFSLLGVEE